MRKSIFTLTSAILIVSSASAATITGELKLWHKVTLGFEGPASSEYATPNPFMDYRLDVTFTNGSTTYVVPGYYAADGNAAETSATSGNIWLVHFAPDKTGTWNYQVSFHQGSHIAVDTNPSAGSSAGYMDEVTGSFDIRDTDKSGLDYRGKGMARYVNKHHVQFAGSGEYYLKGGADSPENFLGYWEFDNTYDQGGNRDDAPLVSGLHHYAPHSNHYSASDASAYTWQDDKGKNILGAIKYLSDQGMNSIYFLTYNIDGGDGQEVWPWAGNGADKLRYDCSKLEQWERVFCYMDEKGIQLHVVLQESENDLVLGGVSDMRRMLYHRELCARFSHHLNMTWNLGEENGNTDADRRGFCKQIGQWDPYNHPRALHINDNKLDRYTTFYDEQVFEVASIQSNPASTNYNHAKTVVIQSAVHSRSWMAYEDEQNKEGAYSGNADEMRKETLWGNLMGGGAGVEWYFAYRNNDFHDLKTEDWTKAAILWGHTRHALEFFHNNNIPFWEMSSNNLSSNPSSWCLAKTGEVYVVYLKNGGTTHLDLSGVGGSFEVKWYDPRNAGSLQDGSVTRVEGGGSRSLGTAPNNTSADWVILVTG